MPFCSTCGAQIDDKAIVCAKCGVPIASNAIPTPPPEDDKYLRLLLPIGRSGWAIAAGYLGLFSAIPVLDLLAVIFGVVAIHDIGKHPDRHGLGRAWFGVIVGSVMTAFHAIVICVYLAD